MAYLIDTKIALRLADITDPDYRLITNAIAVLSRKGEALYYTQQTRREFWNVCTRPATVNGRGMTTGEAILALGVIDNFLSYLPDSPATGPIWDRLVRQYDVKGRAVHDAQLVASMLANGMTHILTLNGADFQRYNSEIHVLHPRSV